MATCCTQPTWVPLGNCLHCASETQACAQCNQLAQQPSLLTTVLLHLLQDPLVSVSLIRTVDELPTHESAHLPSKGRRPRYTPGSDHIAWKFSLGMLADGTMTTEVQVSHALIQWPYLSDMTFINAIVSVFYPAWCMPPPPFGQYLILRRYPWFYFNLLISESEVRASPVLMTCCYLAD